MSSHAPIYTPSAQTLTLARLGILLAVLMTALASIFIVESQLQRHQIYPDQIPIANLNFWKTLAD
ncbi:MAG: hypothetical protein F6J95_021575 [Leptolyngbya sp. SIO1E4]|nr:hypothetical protein [Leptolyngbya sp. SIO1E4]